MLAECYTGEFGLEKDEHLSSEWIEKATLLNCPGAMHKKAKKILKVLDCTNQDNIHKILSFFESPQGANEIDLNDSTYTPGSEIDQIASPLSTFRSNNRKYRNKKKGRSQSPMKESLSGGEDLGSTSKGEEQEEGKRSGEFDNIKEKLPDNSPGMSNTTMNDTKSEKEGRENGEMDDYNNNDYYDSDYSNLELAVQLLLKSAELNFVAAKTDLGILFELAADDQRAVEW